MITGFGQLTIGLLGPLSARLHGQELTPNAAKQRQILALLALNAGQVVTITTLIEELSSALLPLGILLGFSAVLIAIAVKVFRWDEV